MESALTGRVSDRNTATAERSLRVRIVVNGSDGFRMRLAIGLFGYLPRWKIAADMAHDGDPTADVNHWMVGLDSQGCFPSGRERCNTVCVVSTFDKTATVALKRWLDASCFGICTSRSAVEAAARHGLNANRLCYVTPGHDGMIRPRRIVLGITSRCRPDGAKREDILLSAAKAMRLDDFHLQIIGRGWGKVVPRLEAAGATVLYYPGTSDAVADYQFNLKQVSQFDYYLYLGFDDGSMGFLDALAAGVPTIVTPDGFHLDVPGGITHAFSNAEELCGILERICRERHSRKKAVEHLTWDSYAEKHLEVWNALLAGHASDAPIGPADVAHKAARLGSGT